MKLHMVVVDAFAARAFRGNQAAVCANQAVETKTACFTDPNLNDSDMQNIAMEMNLSETAFVKPVENDDIAKASVFDLRWFTPKTEVPLCGHATLATAHVIFNEYGNINEKIQFNSLSGPLFCSKKDNKISMDFPAYVVEVLNPVPELIQKLVACLGTFELENVAYAPKAKKLIVHFKKGADISGKSFLQKLNPDFQSMMHLHPEGDVVKGIIATVQGTDCDVGSEGQHFDFVSRYFAPWVGIQEDPATGSAHCASGPYWSQVLNKTRLHGNALQAYPCRGAELLVEVDGDKVNLLGAATTVLDGVFHFQP